METKNNSDHEKEGISHIKEEPLCLESAQCEIGSTLSNASLQKDVAYVSSDSLVEFGNNSDHKMEIKIDIKEEPWYLESSSPEIRYESKETPPSEVQLANGLVYVSCDSARKPQNITDVDGSGGKTVIKKEPMWMTESAESKDDMKDTGSTVNSRYQKLLSMGTLRTCTEAVCNSDTNNSVLSTNADLQKNDPIKIREENRYCKISDIALENMTNNDVQENDEIRTKIEIEEETWWMDQTSSVNSEPEDTLLTDAELQSNTKRSLAQFSNIKMKRKKCLANEMRELMKTGGDSAPVPELELAVPHVRQYVGFQYDSGIGAVRPSPDVSTPSTEIVPNTPAVGSSSSVQDQSHKQALNGTPAEEVHYLLFSPQRAVRKHLTMQSLMEEERRVRLERHRLQMEGDKRLQLLREKEQQLLEEVDKQKHENFRKEIERRMQALKWEHERKMLSLKREEERKMLVLKWEKERKKKAFDAEKRRKEEICSIKWESMKKQA